MVGYRSVSTPFRQLLKRLQKKHRYPSVRAFAQALGIADASRLSRGSPFDVKGCLRLALVTGEPPSVVLRAAGKADIAAMIEQLYGTSPPQLTAEQQQLLQALDAITDPATRAALIQMARAAVLAAPAPGSANPADTPSSSTPPTDTPPHGVIHRPDVFPRRAAR